MDEQYAGFLFLPSTTGGGVLVKNSQVVGARPNGPNDGAIVYTEAGPAIYTSLTTGELSRVLEARTIEASRQ